VGVQDVVIDRRDESRLAPDAADSAAPAQLPVAQQAGSAGGV
jgi:hypothetical protein